MPLHEPPIRRVRRANRRPNRPLPKPQQPSCSRTPPTHFPGYQDPKPTTLRVQAHRPTIQCLVMHRAQRQAIRHHISAIVGVPPNMRGLQSEQSVAEPDVILTHGAAFVVRLKDLPCGTGDPGACTP